MRLNTCGGPCRRQTGEKIQPRVFEQQLRMRWLPVNMLALVALLASVYAQTTPPGTVDYSCLHSASQQINCDANLNPYYNSMTDVYNAQYSSLNPNYFNGNAYIYNAYDIPYYSHTVTSCDIDSLVSRPYRVFEEV